MTGEDYIYFDETGAVKVAFEKLEVGSDLLKKCGLETKLCLGRLFMAKFEFVMKYNLVKDEWNKADKGLEAGFVMNSYDFNMTDGIWTVMIVISAVIV